MNEYYVYAHVDKETNEPFYIGKGKGKRAHTPRKHPYYLEFTSEYLKTFKVEFIAKNISEPLSLDIEDTFIRKFGKLHEGTGCLINFWGGWAHEFTIDFSEEYEDITKKYKFIKNDKNEKIFEVNNLIPFDFGNNKEYYTSHLNEDVLYNYDDNGYSKFNFTKSHNHYIQHLTEYGKYLFDIDIKEYNASKIIYLFNEMTNKTYKEEGNKLIEEVKKQTTPRKPWETYFSLLKSIDKNSVFSVCVSNQSDLIEDITNIDLIKKISKVTFSDNDYIVYNKIGIYFGLVIKKNVWLEVNGERITKPDMNWRCKRPKYNALMKIIKSKNEGLDLKVKYIRLPHENEQENNKDIAVFEISVEKRV